MTRRVLQKQGRLGNLSRKRIAEDAERIRRHKEEDEERIRRHEEEMCHLRIEADNIRRRWMLQEVWKDAEERRRKKEDED